MPPFHIILVLSMLTLSLLACPAVVLCGRRQFPPVPLFPGSLFPNRWDTLYTVLFSLGFALSLAASVYESATAESAPLSTRSLALSMALQAFLYMPMVVRYVLLPGRGGSPLSVPATLRLILGALALNFAFGAMLQTLRIDELIMQLTSCPAAQDVVMLFSQGSTGTKIVIGTAAVIMAPIGEEVCFRGFIYNILRQRAGVCGAAIASSLLFGAVHASLVQLLPLTFFAIIQCVAYEKSRTLAIPICIHALFNATSLALLLFCPESVC